MPERHVHTAIIGAGFGGIGQAIVLRNAGFDDVAILERGDELGGTWRDNTYPGCACDVASHLYSFSFAPNPDWSEAYSGQREILEYLRSVAAEHDVERLISYGTEVREARWDEGLRLWRLTTSAGALTANVVISATGPFGNPVVPEIPGADRFRGKAFHSFEWDHDHDLAGERVAVIGTGPSAVQFVPEIQPEVERLVVFQRTAPWIMPRLNRPMSGVERELFKRVPLVRQALRGGLYAMVESIGLVIFVDRRFRHFFEAIGRAHLRRQVPDPDLRAKLTPDYTFGCKRAILSDDYLPALARPNVDVVTEGVAEIREGSVVDAAGIEHEVDTLIYGTGFEVPHSSAERVKGRDGRSVMEVYRERPQSYLGTAMAGFPNFFMLLGPFAGAGNQSALYTMESQMSYVAGALRAMRERNAAVIDVRPEAQAEFTAEAERRSADTVWLQGGCRSYYQTPDGTMNAGLWPSWSFDFRRRTRRFDPAAFELEPA